MTVTVDYLIIGQGLAGSIVAWQALFRNKSIHIIDQRPAFNASKVAAGLIDPIAGRRYFQAWKADLALPYLTTFYPKIEAITGYTYYYQKPSIRFFTSPEDRTLWKEKHRTPKLAPYFPSPQQNSFDPDICTPYGCAEVRQSGYLDTVLFLEDTLEYLRQHNQFSHDTVKIPDLILHNDRVEYKHITAKYIIFCEGYSVSSNPYFNWLPWNHSKGNILTVKTTLPTSHILHYGKWILPTHNRTFKVGATYNKHFTSTHPDPEAKEDILIHLSTWITPPIDVIDHQAAIRPISIDNRPIIGRHPKHPRLILFNGLGSRGSSLAPYYSDHLFSYLEKNAPLDQDVDINRFSKKFNTYESTS